MNSEGLICKEITQSLSKPPDASGTEVKLPVPGEQHRRGGAADAGGRAVVCAGEVRRAGCGRCRHPHRRLHGRAREPGGADSALLGSF